MRTLNLYITRGILSILLVAVLILTFGMLGGNLFKALEYLTRGVPFIEFLKFLLYMAPMMLSYTIPWAILVAVLLLFGRMSANNEITAMRACGISIFQIISPLIILTFILTFVCLYLQTSLSPYYLGKSKVLLKKIATTSPEALISPGKPANFGNMVVYVKKKDGKKLKDVQIFSFNKNKTSVKQDITASSGKIKMGKQDDVMKIVLYDYNIINYEKQGRIYGDQLEVDLNIGQEMNQRPVSKDPKLLTMDELFGRISLYNRSGIDTTECEVYLNMRLAMGLAPIAFLMLGLPLAIRTSRSETSVGLFISVVLAGVYFFFMITCKSLHYRPELYPQLLIWLPNILYQVGGGYFIYRLTRK